MALSSTAAAGDDQSGDVYSLNGLAATPPLGWNSWNFFGCDVNEDLVKGIADAMASSGMKAAGYQYVIIDDCWQASTRDANGRLQPDPTRFPGGMAALAAYVHGLGLKFGIYSSAGTLTCQLYPASLGNEVVDAQTFADWGVDYLKYDNCGQDSSIPGSVRYQAMADALAATSRDIVFGVCEWGAEQPWNWAAGVGGNLWRTTFDIVDTWPSIMNILDHQVGLEAYSRPGTWNDPDMLEVGNGGMTTAEYEAHFSLWALLNAPLLAGNDLRSMSADTTRILTNKEIIAIDQDWAGTQGHKLRDDGDTEIWGKPLSDGSYALVLLNRGRTAETLAIDADDLTLPSSARYTVRDVWAASTSLSTGVIRAYVPAQAATTYVVTPQRSISVPALVTLGVGGAAQFEPGKPRTVSVTATNDGPKSVRTDSLTLSAPQGWAVAPKGNAAPATIKPGDHRTIEFKVTAPAVAAVGASALTAHVSDGERNLSAEYPVDIVTDTTVVGVNDVAAQTFVASTNGAGEVKRNTNNSGTPLTVGGVVYPTGLGTRAPASVEIYLGGDCEQFTTSVGVDDTGAPSIYLSGIHIVGALTFEVWGDDVQLARTGLVKYGDAVTTLTADVRGYDVIQLIVTDGNDSPFHRTDFGDWLTPTLACSR